MKKIFLWAQLSDGKMACCEFTSNKPWIPVNANDVIDPHAVPVRFRRIEFEDPYGIASREVESKQVSREEFEL